MMRQIHEMNQDLQNQLETISKKSGLSYDKLQELIRNPALLSREMQLLKKEREKEHQTFSDQVWAIVGKPSKPAVKKRENVQGERKAKTLGARKKWIPMR